MNESFDSQASKSDAGADAASSSQLELLDWAIQQLEDAERTAPRRTAEWLLTEVLDCDRGQLYAHPERPVASAKARRFEGLVEQRVQGKPLQHILGYASFYGLRIQVSPDVMVPRPETEEVVERALACIVEVEAPRVLDAGTGSGCIALALKHERSDATVHACDISPDALEMARANARRLQLDVRFLEADLTSETGIERLPGDLDLLVANPPYIPDEEADTLPPIVREYDPPAALFSGDDPLFFYRALATWAQALCRSGAAVVFEVHAEYAEKVAALLRTKELVDIQVDDDLAGRPRIVWGRRR